MLKNVKRKGCLTATQPEMYIPNLKNFCVNRKVVPLSVSPSGG